MDNLQYIEYNIENNFYTKIIRKIFLIISIMIFTLYYGFDFENNRNLGWEILRILEIIIIIVLLFDLLYLQIFYIKLVRIKNK